MLLKFTNLTKVVSTLIAITTILSCQTDNEATPPSNMINELSSDFSVNTTNITTATTLQFLDKSKGSPTSWNWKFEGGEPETSTEKNPFVTYMTPGTFEVSLEVSKGTESSATTKAGFISVEPISTPPFDGTVWINEDIITSDDPSLFQSLESTGRGIRTMFDRRVNGWIEANAHLFEATYSWGQVIEFQVNPEFTATQAKAYAEEYAHVIGKLPRSLFKDLKTAWIHNGNETFGGGNNSFDIYIGFGETLKSRGVLEEVFLHEGCHVSIDSYHKNNAAWFQAQLDDPTFISTYAKDNRNREDMAESFSMYFALKYRPQSLTNQQRNYILAVMPNRVKYFDSIDLDFTPWSLSDDSD